MKKILSALCFLMVASMLISVATVGTFAAETTAPYANLGQSLYSTGENNYMSELPIDLDGYIYEDEGWVCVSPDFVNKTIMSGEYRFDSWKENKNLQIIEDKAEAQYSSNFKYYVAQTETDVYIGIVDYAPYFENDGTAGLSKACESLSRNIYAIRLGFDSSDYSRALFIREVNGLDQLVMITDDSYKNINNSTFEGLFSYGFARYDNAFENIIGQANNLSINQHHWSTPVHQWIAHIEIKINKELLKKAYVATYGEGSDANINFETIFISASASATRADPTTSNSYMMSYPVYGTIVSNEVAAANSLPERYIPDIIVFEELAPETTAAPETEIVSDTEAAESTEPEITTENVENTEANVQDDTPVDQPSSSCKSAVSFVGIALVTALGACTVCLSKKRED